MKNDSLERNVDTGSYSKAFRIYIPPCVINPGYVTQLTAFRSDFFVDDRFTLISREEE